MTRNQAIEIARQRALNTRESHGYLPVTEADAQTWMPHEWVIDAILWATMQRDLAAQQAVNPTRSREEVEGDAYTLGMRYPQQAAQPVARPDGRLHADGYFTWTRRDGYVLDAKLPCDFYLAAQPQQAADELGWLIEMQFGDGLLWWSGCFDDDGTYPPSRLIARMVNDVNKAVRFSRREDAQRVLDAMLAAQPCPLLARAKTLYSVHEHMWPEAAQPQQAEGDTP